MGGTSYSREILPFDPQKSYGVKKHDQTFSIKKLVHQMVVGQWVHFFPIFMWLTPFLGGFLLQFLVHSGKQTWQWNIPIFNRKYIDSIRVHFPASELLVMTNS